VPYGTTKMLAFQRHLTILSPPVLSKKNVMDTQEATLPLGFSHVETNHDIGFFIRLKEIKEIVDPNARLTELARFSDNERDPVLRQYALDCFNKQLWKHYKQLLVIAREQKDLAKIEELYEKLVYTYERSELLQKVIRQYRKAFKTFLREASKDELIATWKRSPRKELYNDSMKAKLKKRIYQRDGYLQ
jgi:hypothetical protein